MTCTDIGFRGLVPDPQKPLRSVPEGLFAVVGTPVLRVAAPGWLGDARGRSPGDRARVEGPGWRRRGESTSHDRGRVTRRGVRSAARSGALPGEAGLVFDKLPLIEATKPGTNRTPARGLRPPRQGVDPTGMGRIRAPPSAGRTPVPQPPRSSSVGSAQPSQRQAASSSTAWTSRRPSRHHRPLHRHFHHRAAHRARHRAHHGLPHHLTHRLLRAAQPARPPGPRRAAPARCAARRRAARWACRGSTCGGRPRPESGDSRPRPLTRPGHQPPAPSAQSPYPARRHAGPLCSPPRHERTMVRHVNEIGRTNQAGEYQGICRYRGRRGKRDLSVAPYRQGRAGGATPARRPGVRGSTSPPEASRRRARGIYQTRRGQRDRSWAARSTSTGAPLSAASTKLGKTAVPGCALQGSAVRFVHMGPRRGDGPGLVLL